VFADAENKNEEEVRVGGGCEGVDDMAALQRYLPWPLPTSAVCEEAVVTVRYLGFHRVWQGSGKIFDSVDLWLPDVRFETQVRGCVRSTRKRVLSCLM
jgi:hypothetical protein